MNFFYNKSELASYLLLFKEKGATIGFVPTMGALHAGHLSLIAKALKITDVCVCSIFVNPTQFNDPDDLKKYPRTLEADSIKLETGGCHILFAPEVKEMYKENEQWHINLEPLDILLEGEHRPGHYQGVTQVVKKLFDIVKPDLALFGQKDYQQFKVIEKLVAEFKMSVKPVMCEIVRDSDGLAMSSRNVRLSQEERKQALTLSRVLFKTGENFNYKSLAELKEDAVRELNASKGIKLDYFEIANGDTLLPAADKQERSIIALTAAYVGEIRLIDNLILK